MVSVLVSSAVDHGFEPLSCQAKDYKIGICCFSAKHSALKSMSKHWLALNQDNVSEWSKNVYPFTVVSVKYPIKRVGRKVDLIITLNAMM